MKKILCLLLSLTIICTLAGCRSESLEKTQDDSPVTMYISLGNNEDYYRTLAENIKTDLGIDTEFVYSTSADTTSFMRLCFEHKELPADIVFTASQTDDSLLKDSCVDMVGHSALMEMLTSNTVNNCSTDDGAIYQLPVTTRLIGITYNDTLMKEMGWETPETFQDMVDLKAKCDEAGIKFAVTDGAATGHGFNWLFHLMGSDWINTPAGTEWFNSYQAGKVSIDEFKDQCSYFKKWTEAGLWGSVHNEDWNGSAEFSQTRALFWFGIINSVSDYSGQMLDEEGQDTGVTLNDTYKTIPWISEDGTNNCYTRYDSCWIYINKELEAPQEADKLEKVYKILEYIYSTQAVDLTLNIAKDTYVSVRGFEAGDDRLYADYKENINTGYLQPWYYNEFDMESIVETGGVINSYILGEAGFDDIFDTLDQCNTNNLNAVDNIVATFPNGLDCENTTKLAAISQAMALNKTLEENGSSEEATVSIMPYAPSDKPIMPWKQTCICTSTVFSGDFKDSISLTIFPNGATYPTGVYMTGAQIEELIAGNFDPSDQYVDEETGLSTFDSEHYGPYPYACVVKGNEELKDDQEYLVAINDMWLPKDDLTSLTNDGKHLGELENPHSNNDGFHMYIADHFEITPENLSW